MGKRRDWKEVELIVYVPSTYQNEYVGEREFRKRVERTVRYLSGKFGGTTRFAGIGTWAPPNKPSKVVEERVAYVTSFVDEKEWNEEKRNIFRWLRRRAKEWGQEVISFERDNDLTFVKPTKSDSVERQEPRGSRGPINPTTRPITDSLQSHQKNVKEAFDKIFGRK